MRRRFLLLTALVAGPLAGCASDPLSVQNQNNPNADALLSSPGGTETIVSKLVQQMFNGNYGSSDAIWPQTTVMGLESEATVANFGLNSRGAIPRLPIDNVQGNAVQLGNNRDYSFLTRNAVLAARSVNALKAFESSFPASGYARNRAFAFFALGYGLGHLSLIYDSVAVATPASVAAGDTIPGFSSAVVANRTAIAMLDSAVAIAGSAAATSGSGWNIPAIWLASPSSGPSRDEFVRMVRSFRARIRTQVARSSAERLATNWQAVYDDATNGLQADLVVALGPGKGWTNAWVSQAAVSGGWHQMPYWITGMADTSGAYSTWLGLALGQKQPFLIVTPDRRFPRGETRAAQQAFQDPVRPSTGVYFRNRPSGEDTPGAPSGLSWYDHFRFYDIRQNAGTGNWVWFSRAENDMLGAEAAIRLGRLADAATLIDRSRVRNGLPSVAGLTALGQEVPGGQACVPRVPTGGGATRCGDLYEAMKYEKRMETAFTGYASWFLDSRGWGDLIRGTAIEWAAPYQETDARNRPYYANSRVTTEPGTYAFVP
jgi:hypothetical protein